MEVVEHQVVRVRVVLPARLGHQERVVVLVPQEHQDRQVVQAHQVKMVRLEHLGKMEVPALRVHLVLLEQPEVLVPVDKLGQVVRQVLLVLHSPSVHSLLRGQ